MEVAFFLAGAAFGFGGAVVLYGVFALFRPWMRAFLTGAPVSLIRIIGMRLRGCPALLIIDARTMLVQSGHSAPIDTVERTYLMHRSSVFSPEDLAALVLKTREQQGSSEMNKPTWP
jgi:hypothetical protein